jgi:NAD+ synthetase
MKFAIAQLNPTVGDLAHNAQQVLDAAHQADRLGAQVLVTTELVLCGYPPRDLLLQPGFIEAMADTLDRLAAALPPHLAVLVGFAAANPKARYQGEKPLYNSTALLRGGRIEQVFHKQLLPTYDVFDENRYFAAGAGPSSFTLPLGDWGLRVGVTICEDLWNDEEFWGGRSYPRNPIAELADQGVDLILNLSASPYSLRKAQVRRAMLAHSASRFRCPILYANQVGANDDLIFDGTSLAFDRQGELVARLPAFQAGLAVVEYDPIKRDLCLGAIAPLAEDDNEALWSALVLGVRDYSRKCGFTQAVIGLSGGIDSALVAAIAAAALGPKRVLGVLMPSPYSSDHSVSDALALAQNLGIAHQTLPIGPLMADYDRVLEPLFAGTDPGVAEENIQSRIRGNLLMAIANKFGHLLLSTGNKSEMAVGYCTLYGDMNGGLAVIADLPKTRVYALCDWVNRQLPDSAALGELGGPRPLIPPHILTKPPSAELKPGQVDQDSLPPYDLLDDILERLVQSHESVGDIVAAGHDPAVVEKVVRLVARAEFKRRQAPPVLKVTDRAFGLGWRMPIANRWPGQTWTPVPQPQSAPV